MDFRNNKRTVVTVDDRRAVLTAAKARDAKAVAKVPHNVFIRQMLKERMGWTMKEPAPESAIAAANQMGLQLDIERIKQTAAIKAKAL